MSLTVVVSEPLVAGTNIIDDSLGYRAGSISFTVSAVGGYGPATLSLNTSQAEIDNWLESGLMRHIAIYDHALVLIYEGFVNSITANLGSLAVTRGPILDISNRVTVDYNSQSWNTNPPISGGPASTSVTNDTVSQDQYGIFEIVVSGGDGTSTEMDQLRDSYLAENSQPETSQQISLGSATAPSLVINCEGYYQILDRYFYTDVAAGGTENLSTKIENAISADPNSIFSTDFANIVTNTIAVSQYDDNNYTAYGIINDLVSRGDASDNRYLFQVFGSRICHYNAIPTTEKYNLSLSDPKQIIETAKGRTQVYPWNIIAGEWLFLSDFLIGHVDPTNLRDDPRAVFIEGFTFESPWTAKINGSKIGTVPQKMSKMGLGGI